MAPALASAQLRAQLGRDDHIDTPTLGWVDCGVYGATCVETADDAYCACAGVPATAAGCSEGRITFPSSGPGATAGATAATGRCESGGLDRLVRGGP